MFGVFVMLFIIFVLEETLPHSQAKEWAGWREFLNDSNPLRYHRLLRLWCCPARQHAEDQASAAAVTLASNESTQGSESALLDEQRTESRHTSEEETEHDQASSDGFACAFPPEPAEMILRRTQVLRVILVSSLLGAFGSGVFALSNNVLLGALHYKQEELVFLGVFSKVLAVPSGLLAAALLPTIGCYCAWVSGSLLTVVGFGCFTTLGYYGPYVCMFIWTLAFSFIKPAVMVYLSIGLRKEDQAKGVAILAVLDILPAAFAPAFFTAVFFDPSSTQTTAFVFAGGVFLLMAMIVGFGLPHNVEVTSLDNETRLHAEPKMGAREDNTAMLPRLP